MEGKIGKNTKCFTVFMGFSADLTVFAVFLMVLAVFLKKSNLAILSPDSESTRKMMQNELNISQIGCNQPEL